MGALAREQRSQPSSLGSTPTKASESRRPAGESPFSHARVNLLSREKNNVDNQVFEMGPRVRSSSLDQRANYERGHSLGVDHINQGMPWSQPNVEDDSRQPRARRHTLRHERLAADQDLEWVPKAATQGQGDAESELRSRARVNVHARELANAAQTLEMAPAVIACSVEAANACTGVQYHGRVNVLTRETAEDSAEAPAASGYADGGVPTYGRKRLLPPYVKREPMTAF